MQLIWPSVQIKKAFKEIQTMGFDSFIEVERRIQAQLDAGTEEIMNLKDQIFLLRNTLTTNNEQSVEILALYANIKSFLKVMGVLESVMVWLTKTAAGVGIIWIIWKYGVVEAVKSAKDIKENIK